MPTTAQELDTFTALAGERLPNAGELSLDELCDLWRAENPSDEQHAENVAAVSAAIPDFQDGDRGTPAGEHSDQLRCDPAQTNVHEVEFALNPRHSRLKAPTATFTG